MPLLLVRTTLGAIFIPARLVITQLLIVVGNGSLRFFYRQFLLSIL